MTSLESYVGKYEYGNDTRYVAYLKFDGCDITDVQDGDVDKLGQGMVEKIRVFHPDLKFDKVFLIPLRDYERCPAVDPISDIELTDLVETCRISLPNTISVFQSAVHDVTPQPGSETRSLKDKV